MAAANATGASGKTTEQLWDEARYRADAPGKNECIDPYDVAIEDYSSNEEDGQGQWGNRESLELDGGDVGAGASGARVHKRQNKPHKSSIVKAARPVKAYQAKSSIAAGCLKKSAATPGKVGESAQARTGAVSVRPPGRQKRSVSFSEELSIVGNVSIASAAAAAALITPAVVEAASNAANDGSCRDENSVRRAHLEGLGSEKVHIGGDSPDAAPLSSSAGCASTKSAAAGPVNGVVRVVTPKAIDSTAADTKPAGGIAAACLRGERREEEARRDRWSADKGGHCSGLFVCVPRLPAAQRKERSTRRRPVAAQRRRARRSASSAHSPPWNRLGG